MTGTYYIASFLFFIYHVYVKKYDTFKILLV
jgi:hypothetical protein